MNKKLLRRIFPIAALMLLLPWPIAYGYEVSGASAAQEPIRIAVAGASVQPAWTAFGDSIGGVKPGDLFYIDAIDSSLDFSVTLYITNVSELFHTYRYLTLKVGLYKQVAADAWDRVTERNGEPVPDKFITMSNGQVRFTLPGCARYKVTIDKGSFYSYGARSSEGSLSPVFYLEIS